MRAAARKSLDCSPCPREKSAKKWKRNRDETACALLADWHGDCARRLYGNAQTIWWNAPARLGWRKRLCTFECGQHFFHFFFFLLFPSLNVVFFSFPQICSVEEHDRSANWAIWRLHSICHSNHLHKLFLTTFYLINFLLFVKFKNRVFGHFECLTEMFKRRRITDPENYFYTS